MTNEFRHSTKYNSVFANARCTLSMSEIQRTWKERRDVLNKEKAQNRVNEDPIVSVTSRHNPQLNMKYDKARGKWEYIQKVMVGPDVCQKCMFDFGCEKIRVEGSSDARQFFINI